MIAKLEKVRIIIYGKHAIRAATAAMRADFSQIRHDGGAHNLGSTVATVAGMFSLQGDDELHDVEERFLA